MAGNEIDFSGKNPAAEAARKILDAFDRLGLTRVSAADLLVAAGEGSAAEEAVTALTRQKYLREALGQYERTEVGRLAAAGPSDWTLLSRSGCHLCEEALFLIEPVAAKFGARLRVVDIDTDSVLRESYDTHVPVLFVGSRELARHSIRPRWVEDALSQARNSE